MFRFRPPRVCAHCRQVMPRAAAVRCPLCRTPFDAPPPSPNTAREVAERRADEQG